MRFSALLTIMSLCIHTVSPFTHTMCLFGWFFFGRIGFIYVLFFCVFWFFIGSIWVFNRVKKPKCLKRRLKNASSHGSELQICVRHNSNRKLKHCFQRSILTLLHFLGSKFKIHNVWISLLYNFFLWFPGFLSTK